MNNEISRRNLLSLLGITGAVALMPATLSGAAAANNTTLVISSGSDAVTLDPQTSFDGQSPLIWRGVYENLFAFNGGTMELTPNLAESWKVSEDSLVYTIVLRDGIAFTDGEPFNSEAVKFNIERQIAINMGIAYALKNITSIETPDAKTVVITLKEPQDGFLSAFSGMYSVFMISPRAIRENEKDGDWAQAWLRENMVGTGPFLLQKYVQSQQAALVRNRDYWRGWEGDHLEAIIIRYVKDASAARLLLERGETDIALFLPDDVVESIDGTEGVTVTNVPSLNQYYLVLPCNVEPMNDKRVRQAIAYAFDYDGLVNNILQGKAKQARGPIPSIFPGFNPNVRQYSRDIAKAKELLAEAGHPDGGFTIKYTFESGYWWKRPVGELLQSSLREIGINVEIQELSAAAWAGMMTNPETAKLASFGLVWWPTLATPYDYLFTLFDTSAQGTAGYNWGYYSNPEVDRLLAQARSEPSEAERFKLYGEVQEILVEDSPALYLYEKNYRLPMRSNIKGFVFNGVWIETFDYYALSKA